MNQHHQKEHKEQFFHLLACTSCHKELLQTSNKLSCPTCNADFRIEEGIPLFLKDEQIKSSAVISHQKKGNPIKRVLRFLKPPHHSVYMDTLESSNNEGRELIKFLKKFNEKANIVNVGSLSKKIKGTKANILNLDISYYPNIDIVADAHNMPFKNNCLDGVIIKNVFEHLKDPAKVRDELKRVLKTGGRIYAKIPFMQPFHAVPDDYQRYSLNGVRQFFKDFKIIDEGISVGPSSSLAWFLQEYFGILFSFNTTKGYKITRAITAYLTAPIKYFDAFFRKKKEAHRLASAFYIIVEK